MHTVKVNKQAGKAFDLWGLLISKISFSNFPTTAALWTKNPEKSLFAEKIITTYSTWSESKTFHKLLVDFSSWAMEEVCRGWGWVIRCLG